MKISRIKLLLIGLVGIHFFLLINLQFTAWPEMSSFPYLFSKGFVIYKDFVHPYPPLLTLLLAGVYKVFGYKLIVLKLFSWLLVLVNDIFIYLIVKKISKNSIAPFLSIVFYILTQPFLDGNMLWFDTALVTPILVGTYFAIKNFENEKKSLKNLVVSGIFFAVAILIKQTAIVYIASLVLLIALYQKKVKNIVVFTYPILFSVALLLIWLFLTRSLTDFYNWNFYYPSKYWVGFPGYVRLILDSRELKILLFLLVPSLLLFVLKLKEIISNKIYALSYLFLISGVIAVYPRFSFFHFQLALAFCAIIFGIYYSKLKPSPYIISVYLLALAMLVSVPVIKTNWNKETRFWGVNDIKFANLISEKSESGNVYLLGPHSGYYVLSGKVPPKPWLDNFGWFYEVPGVQESTIKGWQENPPASIIIQDVVVGNWYDLGTYQPKLILSWIETNYTKKEEVVPGVWYWEKTK